jgi:predicted amidohydrolase YtcJ
MNVNTKALELAGMLKTGHNHPGIPLGVDGLPTGELKGPEVMTPVGPFVGFERNLLDADEAGLRNFAKLCVRTGTTTITDLASRMDEDTVDMMLRVTNEPQYPIRLMPFRFFLGLSAPELVETVVAMKKISTDRLRLGQIKIVVDGSIQGFSARLRWPGYHNGAPNGLWYIAPEHLSELCIWPWRLGCRCTPTPMGIRRRNWCWKNWHLPCKRIPILITVSPCSIANWPMPRNSGWRQNSACV